MELLRQNGNERDAFGNRSFIETVWKDRTEQKRANTNGKRERDSMSKQAIIIGAGPAGLTAAYELLKKTDIHPVILEEDGTVGGISRTVAWQGNRIDLGGHRFFTKSAEVSEIWQELMPMQNAPALDEIRLGLKKQFPAEGADPEKEDRVFLLRNRISRIFFLRKFFDYPISLKLTTFLNMGLIRTLACGFGYLKSALIKRKENSLEDFYINRFGRPLYRLFFEDYTEKLWGIHPSKIDPSWGNQRVKGLSLLKIFWTVLTKPFRTSKSSIETSLIEEFLYPKKGPGQLWELMAEKIVKRGGEIRMRSKVTGLKLNHGRISEVTVQRQIETSPVNNDDNLNKDENKQTSSQETLVADYVFSSMPIKDLIESLDADIPEEVRLVAADLPYRDFITVGLLLKRLKIRNRTKIKTLGNIVPDCWIYIQDRNVKIGRLQIFNNWSPYMTNDPEKTVWIGLEYFCREGDGLWSASDKDFIEFAAHELETIGIIDRSDLLGGTRIKIKKAYPAYFGSYSRFGEIRAFLDSIENLYCIGRNGQHRYNNMDHSMLTALEAVNAVMTGTHDKTSLWNVNTEEEYHEDRKQQ